MFTPIYLYSMNAAEHTSQNNLAAFILGTFINMLAVADWAGISDYALKALIGGFIWLIFKIIGDILMHKILHAKDTLQNPKGKQNKTEEQEANLEDDGNQQ